MTPGPGELLIRGGLIADGTGAPCQRSDILLAHGKIAAVEPEGTFDARPDYPVLDAADLVVAPGFIDPHSHADESPLELIDDTSKILQGITTEVVGNCGGSPVFVTNGDFGDRFDQLDAAGYVTNYCPLVGHGTLRRLAMGMRAGKPNSDEARRMAYLLDDAMAAGAWGLSSGLIYAPGVFSDTAEMIDLARRLPPGAVYATHMRDEGRHLLRSVEEAIEVGARSGARLQISHLKAAGEPFWGGVEHALAHIDLARGHGTDVNHDVYPYDASSTTMLACLPPWFLEGGEAAVLARLADDATVRRARVEVESDSNENWENMIAGDGYERIVVSSTGSHAHEGMTLSELATQLRVDPFDVVTRLLSSEQLQVRIVDFSMDERDMIRVLTHPRTSVCTDGTPVGPGGKPHPRLYGAFPRVIGRYVREREDLDLPTAVHKMTGLTAEIFGISDRGRVEAGLVADLVAFDPATVADAGSYTDPSQPPTGIRWVMQSGRVVVQDGKWLNTRRGPRLTPRH